MKLHGPIGATVLDANPGLVGAPLDRYEGKLKVTGAARYSYEWPHDQVLTGYIVQAQTSHGTIRSLDTAAAERAPGVRLVLTHKNAPPQKAGDHRKLAAQLTGPEVGNWGQPIALVVADTFEQARAAAHLVVATYDRQPAALGLAAHARDAGTPPDEPDSIADSAIGQFDRAFGTAPVTIDVTYTTPLQSHAAMEPHATIARWEGDTLILETANQFVSQSQGVVADTLQMPKDKVRIVSKYVGGGFGSKLWVFADAILAAIAAKQTGRPVKLALTRPQVFEVTSHRSDTIQRLRLGASQDGTLVAIGHDSVSANRVGETQFEAAALQTRTLYAAPDRQTRHRQASLHVPVASSMRAPGEAVGLLALECAMDELAEKLAIDPIELRLRNEPREDPEKHVPFSSRNLVACLKAGAERFGWDKRPKVATRTDGQWLVGMGVASAIRGNPLKASKARLRLDPDGMLTVQTAMTDIGTGSYTILAQVAASMLGLPIDRVRMELGDSALPMAAGSGGSFGAGSSASSVYDAAMVLRGLLVKAAGLNADTARFENGTVDGRDLLGLLPAGGLVADGEIDPGDNSKAFSQHSYGAHFTEVGVDRDTGEIRVRRMLGVFAAGRVLNAKTARSQAIGGMIFGIGAALHEELVMDDRSGHAVNANLAEYHVPVHLDVPAIEAVFLEELDPASNPLKAKGIGELGICGAGAAIANAVFNATRIRIRDYPLTLDKLLVAMERRA